MDNRLASLLFNIIQDLNRSGLKMMMKKKLCGCYKCTSQVGLVLFKKTVAAVTAQMLIIEALPKSQSYLTSLQKARKRNNPKNSGKEVQIYFAEDILHFDEDPLTFWKKKIRRSSNTGYVSQRIFGTTVTSAPAERLFSIAGNFYTAKRNLLGTDTFRSLMFIKCNSAIYEKVKL